jgi:hypothetical protein
VTRAELRAVAADLRHTGGYLLNRHPPLGRVGCSLDAADEKLARFAGKLAGQVGALAEKIERRPS